MTQLSTLIQGSGKNAIDKRSYIATSGQTAFAVIYSPPYVDVYQNGVRLNVVDYTATSGTSITLTVGAAVNDEIEVIGFISDVSIVVNYNTGITPPAVPIEGMLWYDTTDGSLYIRTGGFWVEASQAGATQGIQGIQGPPGDGVVISGITVTDASYANTDDTAVSLTGGYIKVTGTGFVSGCTIVVGNVIATSVTFISSTEVRAQLPALTAGTYVLYVSNPSGAVAIRVNAITFSALPTWVSTSPLPNGKLNEAISIQLSGTSNSSVTYALQSGSTLPAGVTISGSGLLSGTVTGITTETTYNFTVVATDAELQDSPKAFSITITVLYAIARSLRFRAAGANTGVTTAYLTRTPASATNQKTWTWSSWVKLGTLNQYSQLMDVGSGNTGQNRGYIQFSNQNLDVAFNPTGSSWSVNLASTAVYRDPAAWYHIVVMADTTQATNTNRLKMYVNGQQVTSLATSLYPSLNDNLSFNTTAAHYIGRSANSIGQFDGQMADINFVDGQALTPASFGEVSVTSGAWVPKAYASTYGTNGFYLPFNSVSTSSYAGSFNGSTQYLTAAKNTLFEPTASQAWTLEAWVYLTSAALAQIYLYGSSTIVTGNDIGIYFVINSGTGYISGGSYNGINGYGVNTSSAIPINTWTHVALVSTGSVTTIYVNGISGGSLSNSLAPNAPGSATAKIGYNDTGDNRYFPGYISNFRFVKGTAVYTANFVPPTAPLTAITNTSLLTLQSATVVDNSGNSLAITNNGTVVTSVQSPFLNPRVLVADSSGNANNWTPNNISLTAGSTYDSLLDSPVPSSATVGNYAVMNPLFFNGNQCTLSDGNLTIYKAGASYGSQLSTIGFPTTGKFYFETTIVSNSATNNQAMGIASSTATYVFALDCFYTGSSIRKFVDGTTTTGYGSASNGMVIGVAVDATNGKAYIAINNTWIDSSSPTGGTNGYSMTSGVQYFGWFQGYNSGASAYNFGQRPFTYTPPAGFLGLNTFNLPASAVPNPATAMAATTYTGNGSTQNINNAVNGISFQPDLVWTKSRNNAYNNTLYDSVRGIGNTLFSDATNAEQYGAQRLTSFNSNGYGYGSDSGGNYNAATYVAWQWKAGGAVSANNNTAGTITSTVSANQAAGFSVVGYTGTGANATIGHGLGVAPSFILIKSRNNADNWYAYHTSLGNTLGLNPNLTSSAYSSALYWNSTTPTASVFSIGTVPSQSAWTYIAYCWAAVPGYSKFGSYIGNASTDGPFIYTGFKPRFIMFKADMVASWQIHDSTREPSNESKKTLYPNSSEVEWPSVYGVDLLSNGFKIKQPTGYGLNNSGITYTYAAFAESAFNFATAR